MNIPTEDSPSSAKIPQTLFSVIAAVSICHFFNDMMQSLLVALFPTLRASYRLSFAQLGWISLAYQVTASLLQPVVGYLADRRPAPFSLPVGTCFTGAGLLVLSGAHTYGLLLLGASLLGMGSSIFHPEAARVARMAAGRRRGMAQSLFQLGGNVGAAVGPLLVAAIVVQSGQSSIAVIALLLVVSFAILLRVSFWYRRETGNTVKAMPAGHALPPVQSHVVRSMGLLLVLIFSKFVYVASLTNYFTFYLIERFHLSIVQAQLRLFMFLAALAVGTLLGG